MILKYRKGVKVLALWHYTNNIATKVINKILAN